MKNKITIVSDVCVYFNDYRICGRKPFISENLKQRTFDISTNEILKNIDINDIKKYILDYENNN